jgi:hypothetical protein
MTKGKRKRDFTTIRIRSNGSQPFFYLQPHDQLTRFTHHLDRAPHESLESRSTNILSTVIESLTCGFVTHGLAMNCTRLSPSFFIWSSLSLHTNQLVIHPASSLGLPSGAIVGPTKFKNFNNIGRTGF